MPATWAGDDQGGWLVLGFDSIGLDDLAPARRWAEDQLADLGEEHRTDTVLVVAELLDNAFLHVGGRVRLRLRLDADPCETTVAVADEGGGIARLRDPDSEGGRGLLLVDRICSAWGVSHHDDGKVVWGVLGCAKSGIACPAASSGSTGGPP
ncbi:MAG TPA: ATP-binding protein [Amycolatopsis sp.]|uniref:ATP-binding protein n=1 Tax=Amycolatopsis sp. TaxID=37632 RepID=UPI002F40F87E